MLLLVKVEILSEYLGTFIIPIIQQIDRVKTMSALDMLSANSYFSNALILPLGWCGISACITEILSCSKEKQFNCKGQFHVKFKRHLAFWHCRYSFELEVKAI